MKTRNHFGPPAGPCKVITAILVTALVAAPSGASPDPALTAAVARGDLDRAVVIARAGAERRADDPAAHHSLGVLLVSTGAIEGAEGAFRRAASATVWANPTSGLEQFDTPTSALRRALDQEPVLFALGGGSAAARNNLAAVRILMNRAEAVDDVDAASLAAPSSGVPWVNGGWAWLLRGKAQRAETAGRMALSLGAPGGHAHAVIAAALLQQGRTAEAVDQATRAIQREPSYGHALYIRAQAERKLGRLRDAERDMVRALAMNPDVVTRGLRVPLGSDLGLGGGPDRALHAAAAAHGTAGRSPWRASLAADQLDVSGLDSASQRHSGAEIATGHRTASTGTAAAAAFANDGGGRPGATGGSGPATPGASYGFNQTNVSLIRRTDLGAMASAIVHAKYRHNGIQTQSSSSSSAASVLRDEQMALETSLERRFDLRTSIAGGLAWLQNRRAVPNSPSSRPYPLGYRSPLEPNAQILGLGATLITTGYAKLRHQASPEAAFELWTVVSTTDGTAAGLPFARAHMEIGERGSIEFSVRPRIGDASADLMPVDMLTGAAMLGAVGAPEPSGPQYNREALLMGPAGRSLSFDLTARQTTRHGAAMEVTAFHRRLSGAAALVGDPRLALALPLVAVSHGEMTGLEFGFSVPIGSGLTVSGWSQWQTARGTPEPTDPFTGNRLELASGSLLGMPGRQNVLRVSFAPVGPLVVTAALRHTGGRTLARSAVGSNGVRQYKEVAAPAVVSADVGVRLRLAESSTLVVGGTGLAGGSVYPGYAADRQVVIGIELRR